MDQPKIVQRVQEWCGFRHPKARRSVALHLVNLQERFGPSALSGLADTTAFFNITAPVAHVETVTTHVQHRDAARSLPPIAELPQSVRTLVPQHASDTRDLAPLATPTNEFEFPTVTPTLPYNVPDLPAMSPSATSLADVPPALTPSPNVAVSASGKAAEQLPLALPTMPPEATATPESSDPVAPPATMEPPASELLPAIPLDEVLPEGVVLDEEVWFFDAGSVAGELKSPASGWESSFEQVVDDQPLSTVDDPRVTVGPTARLEATADSSPAPKVNATATPKSEGTTFRLSRPTTNETPLTVSYQLSAFAGPTIVQQTGTAVIPAGAKQVEVAIHVQGLDRPPEVVTLQVLPGRGYEATPTPALQFLNVDGQPLTDAALFGAYRHGGAQPAFEALVARHQASVFRVAYQILGNRADAEDVSQLAFLVLARQDMTIHTSLHYWLQKVTRNASIALLRAKSRRLRYESELAKPAESPSPEESYALTDEVQVALATLPGPLSEAVRLRYLEGWSQQEAAAIVGIPRGTLSQRASQGLQTLRETMLGDHREAG